MIRALSAWLFGVHYLFWDQYLWVPLTLMNVALMLWLANRNFPSWFTVYLSAAVLSVIFRTSPLWHTGYDYALAFTALLFAWSLAPAGSHRWFSTSIGVTLAGTLGVIGYEGWIGYDPERYRARIYAAAVGLAVAAASVAEGWVRRKAVNWRALIAVVWFLAWFLELKQWRTDVGTHAYWVQYWHVALAGRVCSTACLVGWAREKGKT